MLQTQGVEFDSSSQKKRSIGDNESHLNFNGIFQTASHTKKQAAFVSEGRCSQCVSWKQILRLRRRGWRWRCGIVTAVGMAAAVNNNTGTLPGFAEAFSGIRAVELNHQIIHVSHELDGCGNIRFNFAQQGALVDNFTTRQIHHLTKGGIFALGVALPALHVPKDTAFLSNLNEKTAGHLSNWKALYAQVIRKRGCYLVKQTPTQAPLLEDDLVAAFEKVKDAIPSAIHPTIETFIHANSGWNSEAAILAQCEWEWVKPLFDGLKKEKFNLGKATLEFYDEREADLLTTDERGYLARLRDSNRSEAQDEDEVFYRQHRNELKERPALKARWDRFIFGTPIETEDFLLGIALCLEWLFDQDMPSSKRRLKITCDRRTKKDLKDLNEDAGLFFARRYRGLRTLFGNRVTWEIGDLMNFEALSDQWHKASKPYRNKSVAKSALHLKFL
jgi:S-DNA-T family DNA segregation ATPase FtsK/SpoIIIE